MAPHFRESLGGPFLVVSLGGLWLLYLVISSITAWYRLRHVKGPFLASFSHLWLVRNISSGRHAAGLLALSEQYGPLVRIGPNDLLTSDPEIFRRMGDSKLRPSYGRSDYYNALKMDPYHDTLFSLRDTNAHDKLKAKLSFGYGGRENPGLEDGIDEQLRGLVSLIRRKYISTSSELRQMDLAMTIQYYALDVISKVAYGKAFGYLAADSDLNNYIHDTEKMVPILAMCGEVPWLGKIFLSSTFLKYAAPKPTDNTGLGKMMK